MDMKEKLVELLDSYYVDYGAAVSFLTDQESEDIAQLLIDHGVTVQEWIPVTERLPEEHDSYFAKLYGTKRWEPIMFLKVSDDVLAIVKYEDGTRKVKTVHTTDGEWRLINLYGAKEVTHWMHIPEPPKGRWI